MTGYRNLASNLTGAADECVELLTVSSLDERLDSCLNLPFGCCHGQEITGIFIACLMKI
jgi:hypothetical protein